MKEKFRTEFGRKSTDFCGNSVILFHWLLETMKSSTGSVERSGAAQGLSEVLVGLPAGRFEVMLPGLIKERGKNTNFFELSKKSWPIQIMSKAHIREGYIAFVCFLAFNSSNSSSRNIFLKFFPQCCKDFLMKLKP